MHLVAVPDCGTAPDTFRIFEQRRNLVKAMPLQPVTRLCFGKRVRTRAEPGDAQITFIDSVRWFARRQRVGATRGRMLPR